MRNRPTVKYLGVHAPRPYRLDLPKNDREVQTIYLTADERDALVEALYAPSRSYVDDGGALPAGTTAIPQRVIQGVVSDR